MESIWTGTGLEWPPSEICKLIKTCGDCQAAKTCEHPPPPIFHHPQRNAFTGRIWKVVFINLVGHLTLTPQRNEMILVISDHFNRWKGAIAMPGSTTNIVTEVLQTNLCVLIRPRGLVRSGAQLETKLWEVQKSRTTAYHPQGKEVVERWNRVPGDALCTVLIGRDEMHWHLILPQTMRLI